MKRAAAAGAALALLVVAPPAAAQTLGSVPPDPNRLITPPTLDRPPQGHIQTGAQMLDTAKRVPKIARMLRHHPGNTYGVYEKGTTRWQVSWFAHHRAGQERKEIGQVTLDDRSGRVLEAWTGFQVPWTMARGYDGAFGRKVNAPYVWIALCVLFLLPFVDRRRPLRLLHLDLLMVLAFSVSLAYFNGGDIGMSVPLAYPPLVYLLVRMLLVARRRARGEPPDPVRLLVPASWLTIGVIFLLGFRAGLNVTNSNVIDVGYAGVIGADRLEHGKDLYGDFPTDNVRGDTYGPVNYYAYVPFEQIAPWSGRWDDLPAAHGAAIFFDLMTALLLWLLGRRIRGPTLGIALAYGWAACPFSLYALASNSNDSLVAALLTLALLVVVSPPARGAVAALAGLTKFIPLAVAPLFATYRPPGEERRRSPLPAFLLAFGLTTLVVMIPAFTESGGVKTFWERTIQYQTQRDSPFSVWGFVGGLDGLQRAVQIAAAGLALLVAFVPRRRDVVTLSALAAAVMLAVQLGVEHWFYLYVVWFLPLVLVALLGDGVRDPGDPVSELPRPAAEPFRSSPPASVAAR